MELDAKQQVLLAIYTEYQKDIPNMDAITHASLDMDSLVFKIAINKLENEGYIRGAKLHFPAGSPHPDKIVTRFMQMTREGIAFVEEKMDLPRAMSSQEKVQSLREKFGKLGWDALSAYAGNVLMEIMKQAL